MSSVQRLDDRVVEVVSVSGDVSRLEMREAGRDVRARIIGGRRHVVLDLSATTRVGEGQLVLMLLALRSEVGRRGARVVVAAPEGLFERMSASLALDDLIDVEPTLAAALESCGPTGATRRPAALRPTPEPAPMRCLDCGTTWYSRMAAFVVEAGLPCAQCGGRLAAVPAH